MLSFTEINYQESNSMLPKSSDKNKNKDKSKSKDSKTTPAVSTATNTTSVTEIIRALSDAPRVHATGMGRGGVASVNLSSEDAENLLGSEVIADINRNRGGRGSLRFPRTQGKPGGRFIYTVISTPKIHTTEKDFKIPKDSIFSSAFQGDSKAIENYLTNQGDVNARIENGLSLLGCAVMSENDSIIRSLIKAGAALKGKRAGMPTPFLLAIWNSKLTAIDCLIEAHLEIKEENSLKALFLQAVAYTEKTVVERFVNKLRFCDVMYAATQIPLLRSRNANYFAHVFIEPERVDIQKLSKIRTYLVEVIQEKLKNERLEYRDLYFSLFYAVSHRDLTLAQLLLSAEKVTKGDWEKCFYQAVMAGKEDMVGFLLKDLQGNKRINPDTPSLIGSDLAGNTKSSCSYQTPLMLVAHFSSPKHPLREKYLKIASKLIDRGADVNRAIFPGDQDAKVYTNDAYLNSAIHEIQSLNRQDIKSVEICSYIGETTLMRAVKNSDLGLVRLLVEKKANVNAVTLECNTALMMAVEAQQLEIVEFLLEQKADPYICNNLGGSAFSLSQLQSAQNKKIFQLMVRRWLEDHILWELELPEFSVINKNHLRALVKKLAQILHREVIKFNEIGDEVTVNTKNLLAIAGIKQDEKGNNEGVVMSLPQLCDSLKKALPKLNIENTGMSVKVILADFLKQPEKQILVRQLYIFTASDSKDSKKPPEASIKKVKPGMKFIEEDIALLRSFVVLEVNNSSIAELVTLRNAMLMTLGQMMRKIVKHAAESPALFSRELARHLGDVIFHSHTAQLSLIDGNNTKRNCRLNTSIKNMVRGICDFIENNNSSCSEAKTLTQIDSKKLKKLLVHKIPEATLEVRLEQIALGRKEWKQYNKLSETFPSAVKEKAKAYTYARLGTYLIEELCGALAKESDYKMILDAWEAGDALRHPPLRAAGATAAVNANRPVDNKQTTATAAATAVTPTQIPVVIPASASSPPPASVRAVH